MREALSDPAPYSYDRHPLWKIVKPVQSRVHIHQIHHPDCAPGRLKSSCLKQKRWQECQRKHPTSGPLVLLGPLLEQLQLRRRRASFLSRLLDSIGPVFFSSRTLTRKYLVVLLALSAYQISLLTHRRYRRTSNIKVEGGSPQIRTLSTIWVAQDTTLMVGERSRLSGPTVCKRPPAGRSTTSRSYYIAVTLINTMLGIALEL